MADQPGYKYPPRELIAAIYNARHPGEWQWDVLTSGEQDTARRDIVGVLDSVPDGWVKLEGKWLLFVPSDATGSGANPDPPSGRLGALEGDREGAQQ